MERQRSGSTDMDEWEIGMKEAARLYKRYLSKDYSTTMMKIVAAQLLNLAENA